MIRNLSIFMLETLARFEILSIDGATLTEELRDHS